MPAGGWRAVVVNDTTSLLVTIGSVMGALAAIAAAGTKLMAIVSKRQGAPRQWERDDFESVLEARDKEIARCHEDNARERAEHVADCKDLGDKLRQCESALSVRRDQVHDLTNKLMAYQLEDNLRKRGEPNENGEPK